MKVGIEAVDEDHRVLFAILAELESALENGDTLSAAVLTSILTRLSDYVREHFRREEEIQAEAGYSGLEENRRQHAELTQTLDAFLCAVPSADVRATGETMREFLSVWITEHVVKVDRKMRGRILPWAG